MSIKKLPVIISLIFCRISFLSTSTKKPILPKLTPKIGISKVYAIFDAERKRPSPPKTIINS